MRIPKNSDWVRQEDKLSDELKIRRNQSRISWGKVYNLFLQQKIDVERLVSEMKTFNKLDMEILTREHREELSMQQIEDIFDNR